MVEKDDLGLSLSLSFPQNHNSLHFNLMPSLVPSSSSSSCFPSSAFDLHKPSWNEPFPSSGLFSNLLFLFVLFCYDFYICMASDFQIWRYKHGSKKSFFLLFSHPFHWNLDKNKLYFIAFSSLLSFSYLCNFLPIVFPLNFFVFTLKSSLILLFFPLNPQ